MNVQRIQLVVGENFFITAQGVLTHIDATTHKCAMTRIKGGVQVLFKQKFVEIPDTNIRSIIYTAEEMTKKVPADAKTKN